jgi:hypothetical protein
MTPLTLPSPATAVRKRVSSRDLIRRQALQRLYQRLQTVDQLILSLENYEKAQVSGSNYCANISAARKCS